MTDADVDATVDAAVDAATLGVRAFSQGLPLLAALRARRDPSRSDG